jgi:hypothetical protein
VQRIYTDMQQMFLKEPVYSEPGKTKVQLTLENSITSRVLHNQDSLEQRLSKEILSTLSGMRLQQFKWLIRRNVSQSGNYAIIWDVLLRHSSQCSEDW